LAQSDHKLADHGDKEIEHMGRKTRRKWVRTLDKLRETHATELKQLERGPENPDTLPGQAYVI
jgi:hypothetical protein